MAKALDIGVVAWSQLSNGVLTGKCHGRGSPGERDGAGRMRSAMLQELYPKLRATMYGGMRDQIVA
jgi:aryl-alcohol dehydrogenase-like predicted oxidoreductase